MSDRIDFEVSIVKALAACQIGSRGFALGDPTWRKKGGSLYFHEAGGQTHLPPKGPEIEGYPFKAMTKNVGYVSGSGAPGGFDLEPPKKVCPGPEKRDTSVAPRPKTLRLAARLPGTAALAGTPHGAPDGTADSTPDRATDSATDKCVGGEAQGLPLDATRS